MNLPISIIARSLASASLQRFNASTLQRFPIRVYLSIRGSTTSAQIHAHAPSQTEIRPKSNQTVTIKKSVLHSGKLSYHHRYV
jgi:hypothetical protein